MPEPMCRMCSATFEPKPHSTNQAFCSSICRQRWHRENHPERGRGYSAKWRAEHPDRARVSTLQRYGLDLEQFAALLASQGDGCAICGRVDPGGANWHVDHDHACCPPRRSCGECVRGILCGPCNRGLGCFGDSAPRLAAAAGYLMIRSV